MFNQTEFFLCLFVAVCVVGTLVMIAHAIGAILGWDREDEE